MTQADFEEIVQQAWEDLPRELKGKVDNVSIVVEDTPSSAQRRSVGIRQRDLLLGLYEGIPLTKRGERYGTYPAIPDRITLYKKNIELVAPDDESLRSTIREVLIHEVAHYFGMSEEEIRDAGY